MPQFKASATGSCFLAGLIDNTNLSPWVSEADSSIYETEYVHYLNKGCHIDKNKKQIEKLKNSNITPLIPILTIYMIEQHGTLII